MVLGQELGCRPQILTIEDRKLDLTRDRRWGTARATAAGTTLHTRVLYSVKGAIARALLFLIRVHPRQSAVEVSLVHTIHERPQLATA